MAKRRSFFERLTGGIKLEEDEKIIEEEDAVEITAGKNGAQKAVKLASSKKDEDFEEEKDDEAELTVDVYQTPREIVVETMVAGVRPEDLHIIITHEMISIKGKRQETRHIDDDDYVNRELYWGSFSRTIILPQEIEPEDAEAIERHGLITIRLPKIDKSKQTSLKVKSI